MADPTAGYTRWAAWEEEVLARSGPLAACRAVILARRQEVDCDAGEADLVAAHFRKELRAKVPDPDACCVLLDIDRVTRWLGDALGEKVPRNKATLRLKLLGLPELQYTKRAGAPWWIWRGRQADAGARPKRLDGA